ncbi:RluA family pseudouridine synthase [Lewinella sp. W8]|uniref:RluA family pseudouridine synthase n=1 Tax=Lewinella sp. W8 TaxID=2528208 RepID=UPI0015660086|nr:RluA family pseudouridine synthase [Lewinella sp. W8]
MKQSSLDILHEGQGYVVINKPAGIATEKHFNYDTVEARAQVQWKRPRSLKEAFVGIVHRLDRPVSGALLLAKNKSTLRLLNEAFAEKKVRKTYWAITDRPLPAEAGELRHFMARDRMGKKAIAATRPIPGAKEARLKYALRFAADGKFYWEVEPITGRFHQIRAQLATAGAPIIGDATYGSLHPLQPNCIALHARTLRFADPHTKEPVEITAPLPEYWPD